MNNRRNFLKIAGAGITSAVLNPFHSQSAKLYTKGKKIKVGVLIPQSTENPFYPQSFLNGLNLGIDQHKAIKKGRIELITEQVHFATPMIVKEKSQKLISENNVDIITGIVNSEVVSHVGNLFKNAQLPAIFTNAGESYLVNELKQNPFLFFNTLNLFQAAYESGRYAVNNFGKNVAILTSFYDSGYDSLFTFKQGVESADGNIPVTYVAKHNDESFLSDTIEKLKQTEPDCIYLFMNGNQSDEMIRNLHFANIKTPLITSAFSTENQRLINLGEAGKDIISLSSWNKNLKTKENKNFVEAYNNKFNKEPDLFSTIGFETGQLVYEALSKLKGGFSGLEIAKSIKTIELKSPRGNISVNANSGMIRNKLFVNQTKRSTFSIPENHILKTINPVDEFEEQFAVLDNEFRSGWLNPYLFV